MVGEAWRLTQGACGLESMHREACLLCLSTNAGMQVGAGALHVSLPAACTCPTCLQTA